MIKEIKLKINDYQIDARKTAIYDSKYAIIYPVLGLCGESGEVAEKVKKVLRDSGGEFTDEKKEEIKKELGDIIWYIANVAADLGFTLEDICKTNLDKLFSRKSRNKLNGSGDER